MGSFLAKPLLMKRNWNLGDQQLEWEEGLGFLGKVSGGARNDRQIS